MLRHYLIACSNKLTDSIVRKLSWLAQEPRWTSGLPHTIQVYCSWRVADSVCLSVCLCVFFLRQFAVNIGAVWTHKIYVLFACSKEMVLLMRLMKFCQQCCWQNETKGRWVNILRRFGVSYCLTFTSSHAIILWIKAAKGFNSVQTRLDEI